MKEKLISMLDKYQTIEEIKAKLFIESKDDFVTLVKNLNKLVDEYVLYFDEKKGYINFNKSGLYRVRIIKRADRSFAFGKALDEDRDDFFIAAEELLGAFDGDICLVSSYGVAFSPNEKAEAKVVKILERAAIITSIKEKKGKVYIDDFRSFTISNYSKSFLNKLVKLEIVKTDQKQIGRQKVEHHTLKVIEIITENDALDKEVVRLIAKYGLSTDFKMETIKEAKQIASKSIDDENRVDLSDLLTFTIDSSDAKDLDDAVSIIDNGDTYSLYVSIADVSYYVREDSELDKEALNRGTSVYLVDRVIPMLPSILSNDLCSLNPSTRKKTITCEMEISKKNGKVIRHKIYPSTCFCKERLSYDLVNKVLEGEYSYDEEIDLAIKLLADLQVILHQKRFVRGSLNFETNEAKILIDEDYNVTDITMRVRGVAEKIIEEAMLLANETVATHLKNLDVPAIYRIHEEPDYEKLENVVKLSKKIQFKGNIRNQKHLQEFVEALSNDEESLILNNLVIRSMAKARYSKNNLKHFGLASPCYTHFTSPIRRYPDLIVHRLLRAFVFENYDLKKVDHYDDILDDIAASTSLSERKSIDIERDVEKYFMIKYLSNKKKAKFSGLVTSITKFGFFVTLDNGIEGLVHVSNLPGYFEFDERKNVLVSEHKTIVLGDKVNVRVYDLNEKSGKIDFILTK